MVDELRLRPWPIDRRDNRVTLGSVRVLEVLKPLEFDELALTVWIASDFWPVLIGTPRFGFNRYYCRCTWLGRSEPAFSRVFANGFLRKQLRIPGIHMMRVLIVEHNVLWRHSRKQLVSLMLEVVLQVGIQKPGSILV